MKSYRQVSLFFLVILFAFTLQAKIIYVDSSKTSGSNNGKSWTNAYVRFQAALTACVSGDTIWVAKGTYKPDSSYNLTNTSRYYHFRMKHGVQIYGGFAGTETAVSQRVTFGLGQAHATILSGDIGTQNDSTDNCYHVFYLPSGLGLNSSDTLNGFIIADGNANRGTSPHNSGGGMSITDNSPTLVNVTFINNAASTGGGMNSNAAVTCINVLICNNAASISGGGIVSTQSTFINATICYNTAGSYGGGVHSAGITSPTVFKNCIVWGNTASQGNQFYQQGASIVTLYSSCYASGTNDHYGGGGTFTPTSCITSPPLFVDTTIDDYRLLSTSPAKDNGNNAYNALTTDIRGHIRTQNTTIDMGAYEWTSGTEITTTIYVDSSAQGENDGASWQNAFTSLQRGLNYAKSGMIIWVAKGIYKPSYDYGLGGGSRFYHFRMKPGVKIYGGFAGTETAASQRVNFGSGQAHETTLSGDIGIPNNSTDNCYHVLYHPPELGLTSADTLDGFTITRGYADGTYPHSQGGGIYNWANSPTFVNLVIHNDTASTQGGGVYNWSGSPTLKNVVISNNKAGTQGGGIYNYFGSPLIMNDTIRHNTANDGGGIYNYDCSPTLSASTICDNTADQNGGGIYNYGSYCYPVLTNVTFSNNTATNGGGIYNSSETMVTLTNVTLNNNTATNGGGIYNSRAMSTLTSVMLNNNTATNGGGIYNNRSLGGYPVLTNVTFSNNTATNGGGIYNYGTTSGYPVLTNVTLSNNTASIYGGGIYNFSSSPTLVNDTLIANSALYGGGICNKGSSPTLTNVLISNNISSGSGGGLYNISSASPKLTNSTISNNSAVRGGGIYDSASSSPVLTNVLIYDNKATTKGGGICNYSSSPTLTNVTISNNTASRGGGIYDSISSSSLLQNSIVWGNTASTSGSQLYTDDTSGITLHYSCYASGSTNVTGTITDTDHTIKTDPRFLDAAHGDYRLAPVSPCLDAGNNTYNTQSFDIRGSGFAREVNKSSGIAGTIDMGAYEYQPTVDPLPVELASFTATIKQNRVELNWNTATEINNYGFEIERSKMGEGRSEMWEKIGFVEGAGNSNSPKEYSFAEKNISSGKYSYRLKQIDRDGKFEYSQEVEVVISQIPLIFSLMQNYPNPFNPNTVISYRLSANSFTTLKVYDAIGREVVTLVNEVKEAGSYTAKLDGSQLSSGIYFYTLRAGKFTATKKLTLMK